MSTRDDDAGDRGPGDAAPGPEASDTSDAQNEERLWREIVDNYGDRPSVDDLTDLTTPLEPPASRPVEFRIVRPVFDPENDELREDPTAEDGFTPPPLPPPAVISTERRLAWIGFVASPVLLVLFQLFDYPLPGIIDAGLVITCVASFGYLIATMAPHDPDDDGARV